MKTFLLYNYFVNPHYENVVLESDDIEIIVQIIFLI